MGCVAVSSNQLTLTVQHFFAFAFWLCDQGLFELFFGKLPVLLVFCAVVPILMLGCSPDDESVDFPLQVFVITSHLVSVCEKSETNSSKSLPFWV